jgi:hypothetical protein
LSGRRVGDEGKEFNDPKEDPESGIVAVIELEKSFFTALLYMAGAMPAIYAADRKTLS